MIGTRVGSYEVLSKLGEGGMGEVWRARDTKLNRDVALKVLPAAFAGDADRLARFKREAQVLASLNHPHIGAIYGFEDDRGVHALVLELVDGPTLAERIEGLRAEGKGLPLDEALSIARQISDALETAHEQGIIHRDLKPANIKLRPDGTVKVLDFGLAKALEPAGVSRADVTSSPTITTPAMTQMGMILGTAAYMSPEQAKGRPADKRSDVWAFGCVLFEMLTGKRAFPGDDVSDTLAAILMREPDWTALPSRIPRHVETVIKRCLEKDRKTRIPDVSAARFLLDEAPALSTAPADAAASGRGAVGWKAASVVAVVATLGLAAVSFVHFRETPPATPELMRFEIVTPAKTTLQKFAVSPDGRKIAFYAVDADGAGSVWVRWFDTGESRRVVADTGASPSITWSPDSRFIAFPTGDALNKLVKVDVSGGLPQTVTEIRALITGGSWGRDGVIVFGSFGGGIWRVSDAGGAASPLTAIDITRQETGHSTPVLLPDGKHFLYLRQSSLPEHGIYLGSLDATSEHQPVTRLIATSFSPAYASSSDPSIGYVLFLRENALLAQPFDVVRLQTTGEQVRVADHLRSIFEFGAFGVSQNGVLAYQTGEAIGANPLRLTWFDRRGTNLGSAVPAGYYLSLRLSPDSSRVAITRLDLSTVSSNIWLDEFAGGLLTRLTSQRVGDANPVWSPDGSQVAYDSLRSGRNGLYRKASNGAGGEEVLLEPTGRRTLHDWSRDGRFLLYSQVESKTRSDLWTMSLAGARESRPYVSSEFNETQGQFSPDGRWIAFVSDETGSQEIYVRPFPLAADSGKKRVSTAGGVTPRWPGDGRELFFLTPDFRTVMVADVSYAPSFRIGVPVPVIKATISNKVATGDGDSSTFNWDVTADGKKFLLAGVAAQENAAQSPVNVVLNWTALLKK